MKVEEKKSSKTSGDLTPPTFDSFLACPPTAKFESYPYSFSSTVPRYSQNNFTTSLSLSGSSSDFSNNSGSWSSDDSEFSFCEEGDETEAQIIQSLRNVRLPTTKSPIMEALVYCAVHNWGLSVARNTRKTATEQPSVVFVVTDFPKYYRISRVICSKQNPTEEIGSRIKALKRWFVRFPKKKERNENSFFFI